VSPKTKENNSDFYNNVGKAVKERGLKFMTFVKANNPIIITEGGTLRPYQKYKWIKMKSLSIVLKLILIELFFALKRNSP
jgi:hypothetical protein